MLIGCVASKTQIVSKTKKYNYSNRSACFVTLCQCKMLSTKVKTQLWQKNLTTQTLMRLSNRANP